MCCGVPKRVMCETIASLLAAAVESVVTLLRERAQRKRLALGADVSPQIRTIREQCGPVIGSH